MRRSAHNRRYAISLILIFLGVSELAAQTVLTTATRTWVRLTSSGGGNDRYGRNGNWSGGNEPNNSTTRALFTGANLEDPEMNQNRTAGQFHFTSSATRAMTFLEHANDALLTLNASNGDGLIHEGGVTHIFDARFAIANDQTWYFTAANGGLTVNDSFALNGNTLTIDTQLASNTVEFTGSKDPITGTGGFSKEGDGTLIFSGSHSFTGAVDVTEGVVSVRHATGLGTTAGGVTVSSGAALEIQGGVAIGAEALTLNGTGISSNGALRNVSGINSYAGAITLGAATEIQSDAGTLTLSGAIGGATQNLTIDGPGNTTISGVIGTTSGALTKNGSGALILSAANTFTGATTVSDGVVSVRNTTGLGTTAGGVTVSSGAALELQDDISIGAEALTLSGTGVSNNGALRNVSGTNSYAGAITLGAATEIQSDAGTLTLSGGITGATENLTVDGSGNTTISGAIGTTTGTLTKSGSGTLILSADNTYSGGTTISAGTLQIGNAGTTGSVSGDITNNGALVFDRSNQVTYDGDISGSGSLEQAGSDTLILTGANSHTGGTTISSGTLQIGDAGTTGSVAGNITNNSALIFDRSDAISYGDIISGTGSVTQNGSDTLTLSAVNTYTGGTTVNSGTLALTYGAQIGAIRGDLTINSGATLNSTQANTIGWDATNRVDNIIVDGGTVNHTGNGDFGWRLDWTVSDGAILNSNGGTFSNSSATSGSKFSLSTDSTITATTGTSTFNGRVDLRSGAEGSGVDITVNSGAILNIAAGIVDSRSAAGFEKLGDGTLNILGDNAYSGTTTITAGTLSAQDDNALGDTTGGTTVASGATLELTGGIDIGTEVLTLNGTGVSSNGALNSVSGDNTVGGAITLGSATEIQTDADSLTISGDISGATHNLTIDGSGDTNISGAIGTTTGSLSKNGSGTLLLTGANTFSGTTTVNAGTLAVDGNQEQNRLAANAQVTVNSGGTFEYRGVNATSVSNQVDFTVNSGGTLSIVSGESDGGSSTSHIHLGDITLDGGTIDLSYSGTGSAYNNESAQLDGNITVTDDSIIQFGSGATTTNSGLALNGTTSFTVDPSKTLTVSAELEDKDSGANGFTKLGTGNMLISGDNSYTGATTVSAGTLTLAHNNALGTAAAGTTVDSGATLALTNDITVASEAVTNNGTVTNTSGTNTFNGVISGTGVLTTVGGNLTLGATNTYSGDTTINSGTTLTASANNALGTGSTTINSGGTLALTGGITVDQTAYTVSGTGNSSAGAIQNLAGSNRIEGDITLAANTTFQSDAGTLNIGTNVDGSVYNATGDQITLGTNALTFDGDGNSVLKADLTGTGNLIKNGNGQFIMANGTNAWTGTTQINDGEMVLATYFNDAPGVGPLADFGIRGPVVIGDGTEGASTATLTLGTADSGAGNFNNMFAADIDVTINSDGHLDTRGHTTYVRDIDLDGGSINAQTGAAGGNNLFITGDITSTHASQTASIDGFLDFNGDATKTIDVTGTSTLDINARVQDGGIDKTGTGTLILSGGNTFEDAVDIQTGTILVDNDAGLGAVTSGTTVQTGAQLQLDGVTIGNEALTLNGSGVSNAGALQTVASSGASSWAGSVAVNTNSEIQVNSGTTLAISGNITGANTLTVESIGDTTFSGTNSLNVLTKTGAGNLTVSTNNNTYVTANINAGDFTLGTSNILADTMDVNLGASGTFNVGTYTDTIDDLVGSGTLEIASGGNLTIDELGGSLSGGEPTGGFTGTLDVDGIMTLNGGLISGGSGSGSTGELIVTAGKTLEIASNFTFGTVGTMGGGDQLGTLTLQDTTRLVISGGSTVNIGTLNIDGDSVIDFTAASANTLNLGSLTFTGGSSLVIEGWNSWNDLWTTQNFPGATLDIRDSNTAKITFSGFNNTDTIWLTSDFGSKEITVPEPSSYGALMIAFALAAWTTRRPRRQAP